MPGFVREAILAVLVVFLAAVAAVRHEPGVDIGDEGTTNGGGGDEDGARISVLNPTLSPTQANAAAAAAHAALCALTGSGMDPTCPNVVSNVSNASALIPPAFIYDNLLTANLVLSFSSLYRKAQVLSQAGVVNELNITDDDGDDDKPAGSPILIPNAQALRPVVQAAAGIVQLHGLSFSFLAFTPEWAAAQAAFAGVGEAQGAVIAEEEDVAGGGGGGVLGGKRRLRGMNRERVDRRRVTLETEAAADFDDMSRAVDDPTVDAAVRSHPTVRSYVERVLDAAVDANAAATSFDGMFDDKFEMRYPVRAAGEAAGLLDNGFWGDFGAGLDDEAFDAMVALLSGPVAGEEVRAFGDSDESIDEKKRAKLEDLARQLSDVEPKFDFEVSVIARPIVTTLFWGAAARQWGHAAVRIAPDEFTPYTYADPLTVAAVDLIPEKAAAYVEALQAMNLTRGEIAQRLLRAVNVRFVVTVALKAIQQISINGGDILRNIFSLTL